MGPSTVDLRCSVIVFRNDSVLLVRRDRHGDWVLPGGNPEPAETTGSCARREVREETGLEVHPGRCAFVLETIDPERTRRVIEIVFLGTESRREQPIAREPGLMPLFVPLDDLQALPLRPPLAGHLRGLAGTKLLQTAPYLGNLWRPQQEDALPVPGNDA